MNSPLFWISTGRSVLTSPMTDLYAYLINPAYYRLRDVKKRNDPAKNPWSGWDGNMGGPVGF